MSEERPYPYPRLDEDGFQFAVVEQDSTLSLAAPIPPDDDRYAAEPGDLVKLVFQYREADHRPNGAEVGAEHMWVQIVEQRDSCLIGEIDSSPQHTSILKSGDPVSFHPKHIVAFWRE